MSLETMINYYKSRDLTGEEIFNAIGRLPILYSDLKKYSSLNQLFEKFDYCIIMYQTSSLTTGHYIALTRNDKTKKIRYCDSYGLTPLTELQYTQADQPLPKYLLNLLEGVDYEYNRVDFQSKKQGIATCGRWSSLFCKFRNLSLDEIERLFKNNKDPFLTQTDNSACLLTMMMFKDITRYNKV